MKAFFHIFNRAGCTDPVFFEKASTADLNPVCEQAAVSGVVDFSRTLLHEQVARERSRRAGEVLVAIVHPGITSALGAVDWHREIKDPWFLLILISAAPFELKRTLCETPPGVLVLDSSFPESPSADFSDFHGSVCTLLSLVARIESGTPEQRRADCALISELYAESRLTGHKRKTLFDALSAAALADTEETARETICWHAGYDGASEFLRDAHEYDRRDGLTWMGRLSGFHHTILAPRFREATATFDHDAVKARHEWRLAAAELRVLLHSAFPFSARAFARAVVQAQSATPGSYAPALRVAHFLDEMDGALQSPESNALEVIESGMEQITAMLSELRKNWYRFT